MFYALLQSEREMDSIRFVGLFSRRIGLLDTSRAYYSHKSTPLSIPIELIHLTFCPASPNDPQSPRTPLNNAPFQPKLESSRFGKRGQHGARSLDTERTRGFMCVCSLVRPLPGDLAVMLTYDVCSLADGVDRDYGCVCGVVRDCAADVYCWCSLNCREQGFLFLDGCLLGQLSFLFGPVVGVGVSIS